MNIFDFIFIPLILYFGHAVVDRVVKVYNVQSDRAMLTRLFYYHILFALLFGWYVRSFGGDAVGYWRGPYNADWLSMHETGTRYVRFLAYPFSQALGLSFWTGSLLFSMFGFCGFIFIYLTLLRTITGNPTLFGIKLYPWILFLPNMHFWSAGVGKDSVIFFALALFIFCLTNPARNFPGIIVSFYLAFYIRPHIALLMLVGLIFSLLTSTKGVSFVWRVLFLAGSIYVFVLISPAVFEYIGLDEENIESVEDIANRRSTNVVWHTVGSAIDIGSYSVWQKMTTFFFRPLFFDAGNIFGYIVSMENVFYILLAFSMLKFRNVVEILRTPIHLKAALFVAISTAYFMSSSLGNLGIIIRQKNMVMFMFVMVAVYLISKAQAPRGVIFRPAKSHAEAKAA